MMMKTGNELNGARAGESVLVVSVGLIALSESQFQRERRRRREAAEAERKARSVAAEGPGLPGMPVELVDDGVSLQALGDSIRARGVIEPLIVRLKVAEDGAAGSSTCYELVAGERRLLASKLVGLDEVPVIVRVYGSEEEFLGDQIGENLHRDDCSVIEEAVGIRELREEHGLSQEAVGRLLGRSQQEVSKRLRLLELPEVVRDRVAARQVSVNAAQLFLRVPGERVSEALGEILEPPHAPGSPMGERAAMEWLLGRYVRPVEERARWEERRGELVALYGEGIEDPAEDVLDYEECARWWPEGEMEPHYDAPWRLADGVIGEAFLRQVGLHGGIAKAGTTWLDLARKHEVARKVARDGRGSPVLVVAAGPLRSALVADYEARLAGYAAEVVARELMEGEEGLDEQAARSRAKGLAKQRAIKAAPGWLRWHGIEVEAAADAAAGDADDGGSAADVSGTPRGVTDGVSVEGGDSELSDEELDRIGRLRSVIAGGFFEGGGDPVPAAECLQEVMSALCPLEFDAAGCDSPEAVCGLLVEVYLSTLEPEEREGALVRFEGVFGGGDSVISDQ